MPAGGMRREGQEEEVSITNTRQHLFRHERATGHVREMGHVWRLESDSAVAGARDSERGSGICLCLCLCFAFILISSLALNGHPNTVSRPRLFLTKHLDTTGDVSLSPVSFLISLSNNGLP